ncbi:MAG: FtsX-like permease family protein [Gammaproteobacteria bacterium]|nr:FtsX-like permease family protein [Gammaproteobacteria bacterium]
MKTFRRGIGFGLRALLRDFRAGELAVLSAALIIAVASVTAIGFLTDRIGQAVALQAAEVLAADLRLSSPQPLDPARLAQARKRGLSTATLLSFPSVVFSGEDSVLAAINAVSDGYPLRGEVRIAPGLLADPHVAAGVPPRGELWLDTAVLARLGIDVGAQVELGAAMFRVSAVLTYRPDQTPGFASLAPALIMNIDDIPDTGLLGEGSRVSHAQLFAGTRNEIASFAVDIEPQLPASVRLLDRGDAGRELTDAISRAGRFLALASLVSLLLAAVAIAMSARRYAERRLDTAALMKSLGAPQRFVVTSSLTQIIVIGMVASLLGTVLGLAAERALSVLLAGLLRNDLPVPSLKPLALGFGTALILLAGFALPSVLRLSTTPPLRVLRRDLSPPPPGALMTYGAAMAALGLLIYWSVRDIKLVLIIVGGTVLTGAVLFLVGRLLIVVLARGRSRVGVAWRYGLANIARRGSDSAVQVVAFGLGLMVLLVLTLVRNDLLAGWRATLDTQAPNHFLINIQPDERDSVRDTLVAEGLPAPEFVPLVRARMTRVGNDTVGERNYRSDRGRRLAGRGANLTYAEKLSASNRILAGEWWPRDYNGPPLVSVEIDAAREMSIGIGDLLTFDIAGMELAATLSSLREVKWDSFQPNFFMVFSPNALQDYPKTFIASLRVPDDKRGALLKLVRAHPSVSVIDIEAVLDQVRQVIDKAALAVQSVFLFTLAAGLVVLFAAVQSTLNERRYESALLRTFGARRSTVFAGLAAEFVALGLAAGIFAAFGASVVGGLAARQLFDLNYQLDPMLWLFGTLTGVVVVGISGVLAARGAVNTPPIRTLRAG